MNRSSEEEVAHPAEIALGQAGSQLGRDLDDVVLPFRAEVAVGAQRAGHGGQVYAVLHHFVGAVHRVEEVREPALREDEVHFARKVGLEHLVRAIDEIDVLDLVLLDELIEFVHRQVLRLLAGRLELGDDLGQHLVHVRRDALMLGAQHRFEDGEALGQACLEPVDLVILLFRDEPVHRHRGDDRRPQAHRQHHCEQEQADLALHAHGGSPDARVASLRCSTAGSRRHPRRWHRRGCIALSALLKSTTPFPVGVPRCAPHRDSLSVALASEILL